MTLVSQDHLEKIILYLNENNYLFPQFQFVNENDHLHLIGQGGFSRVYEMFNKERKEHRFALKVMGMEKHTVCREDFIHTGKIQWSLAEESPYIVRILELKVVTVFFNEQNEIYKVIDSFDYTINEENTIQLQLVLMEKLNQILVKDKLNHVKLSCDSLKTENEVIKFAIQIGQAIISAHSHRILHRDIKLENIFWDEQEQVYKLGDFGFAKYTDNGNADTIIYTDGYGAPEIEKRIQDQYNETADIYSFGITLYLLLNDLKFPASDGYYPKIEVQYSSDFILPAPRNASIELTRVLQKMCSFRAEYRYQTMEEVLYAFLYVTRRNNLHLEKKYIELIDVATETYRENITTEKLENNNNSDILQETNHKIKDQISKKDKIAVEKFYNVFDNIIQLAFTIVFTLLFLAVYFSFPTQNILIKDIYFWVLPFLMLNYFIFYKLKSFHHISAFIALLFLILSVTKIGLSIFHVMFCFALVSSFSSVILSYVFSFLIWFIFELSGNEIVSELLVNKNSGWLFLISIFFLTMLYFHFQCYFGKYKKDEIRWKVAFFYYGPVILIMCGIVICLLDYFEWIVISDLIIRIHFLLMGIVLLIGSRLFMRG